MFGSNVLEVATGLIFIYLFLSVLCSSINEAISTRINQRGKNLFEGIKNLLNDPNFTGLAQQVYGHGMITGMSQYAADPTRPNRLPSYLPPMIFSRALVDVLGSQGVVAAAHGALLDAAEKADDAYEEAVAKEGKTPISPTLKAALQQAQTDARAALEAAATTAQREYEEASLAAAQKPDDADLARTVQAKKAAADVAQAAVLTHDARRAAVALSKQPKNLKLIQETSNTLENALAIGRRLAENYPDPLGNITSAVKRLPPGHTKEALFLLIAQTKRETTSVEDQISRLEENLSSWYNDAMDRVGGWYKRWTQQVLLGIALVVVLCANADSVMFIQQLTKQESLRGSLVVAAQDAAKTAPVTTQPGDSPAIKQVLDKANALELPLGWSAETSDAKHFPCAGFDLSAGWDKQLAANGSNLLLKIFGLLLSVFAVSLGAPFWFDILGKFVNLRSTGTLPDPRKGALPATPTPPGTTGH